MVTAKVAGPYNINLINVVWNPNTTGREKYIYKRERITTYARKVQASQVLNSRYMGESGIPKKLGYSYISASNLF